VKLNSDFHLAPISRIKELHLYSTPL